MKRRQFLKTTAVGTALLVVNPSLNAFETVDDKMSTNNLPRWRGFNILDFFSPQRYIANPARFAATEQDFKWMADWGFDFVRIPIISCYLKYDRLPEGYHPEETVGFRKKRLCYRQVVYTAINTICM